MRFSPDLPHVDGICFDDLSLLQGNDEVRRILMARGLVWVTVFQHEATEYGGTVFAATEYQAAQIADSRGLGETVDGLHREEM